MSNKKLYKEKFKKSDFNFYNKTVNIYILLAFLILPIFVTNYYFNILITKTISFYILSLIFLFAIFINALAEKDIKKIFNLKDFNIPTIAFFIFIICALISTLLASPYILQAYQGNEGRYNGLQLYLVYFLVYIFVSKYFKFKMKIFNIFIYVSLFVALFGITDYFSLNLLGFKTYMKPEQYFMFASTIGNINTYTAYLALFLSMSMCLFIFTDLDMKDSVSKLKLIFYYMCMLIAFMAINMGNSDNGYLTLICLFAFIPFFAFKSKKSFFKYFLSFTSYLAIIQSIAIINKAYPDKVLGINGIYNILAEFKYLYILLILAILSTIFIYYILFKTSIKYIYKPFIYIWIILLFLGLCLLFILISLVNKGDSSKFGYLSQYLIFNDAWGTYRGYIWRVTIEEFSKLSILKKLFGTGPDTFGIYMYNLKYDDMLINTGQYYDSAHNEYLQYLFTHGILGLLSYFIFIISIIFNGFKRIIKGCESNKRMCIVLGLTYGVFAYAIQACVNINIPISAMFFFIFIMLLSNLSKEK